MAQINGTLCLFKLGASPTTIALVEDATFTITSDLPESSTKDSAGFRELLANAGLRSGTITVNGKADFTATTGNFAVLSKAVLDRANLGFAFGPESGGVNITGSCRAGEVSLGSPMEESCTISGNFETTGSFVVS
jgi:hypothetical protein